MKCPTKEQLLSDVQSSASWSDIAQKYGYTDSRFLRKKAKEWGFEPRRKILKPSKAQLEKMILTEGMSPYQVAIALGYGSGGWSNIYAWCRKYGIEFDFAQNHEMRSVPFSSRQKEIVLGTLLGDGYLRPTNSGKSNCSYALSLCHGEKQLDYLKWKFNEFENFVPKRDFTVYYPQFHGKAPTHSFSTISHPFLKEAHDLCYPNGVKAISQEWLDQLSDLSVAVWYMDDGSLNKRYHTIVLCTNSFSVDGCNLAIKFFETRYGITPVLEKRRNGQFVLRINASQSRKFMDIVSPHIPKCMEYKVW